jgi:NAD(P)-dependent dehydrogenase (short-subunit alcohol dehydrogenase family)
MQNTALVTGATTIAPAAVQIMANGSLNAVTRALAIEYDKDGIRVNVGRHQDSDA